MSWMAEFNDLFKLEKNEIQCNSRDKWKEFCLGTNNGTHSIDGIHIEILQKSWVVVANPKLKTGAML